jgi:LacI family transcriptional regulator
MQTSLKNIVKSLNVSIVIVSWILSGQGPAKGISIAMLEKVKRRTERTSV